MKGSSPLLVLTTSVILLLLLKMFLHHRKTKLFSPFLRLLTSIVGLVMGRQWVVVMSAAVLGQVAVFHRFPALGHLVVEVEVSSMYL